MDYQVGDSERERFEEILADKIKEIDKKIRRFIIFFFIFVIVSTGMVVWIDQTFLVNSSLIFLVNLLWACAPILACFYLLILCRRKEKMFEDWNAGKYPSCPYDYKNYRPSKQ